MPDIEVQLKNSLRSLRIKLGYTQEESAKLLGISPVTLRGWETESGNITIDCIKKIEELYNTQQEYIYFGNEAEFAKLLRKSPRTSLPIKPIGVLIAFVSAISFTHFTAGMIAIQYFQGIAA